MNIDLAEVLFSAIFSLSFVPHKYDMLSYRSLLETAISEETDAQYEAGRRYWHEVQPHMARDWNETAIPCDQWPLDEAGLRALERQVFQKPDWLARWAHFDWRSFQLAHKWNYSKHNDCFNFYDVPSFGYKDRMVQPDRRMVTLTSDGKLIERKTEYSHFYATLPTAMEACMAVVRSARPKLALMRGEYYIRFGKWPENERSRNGINGELEEGVSVYHVNFDLDEGRWAIESSVDEATITGTMSSLFYDKPYRPIYLVQGDEHEYAMGSDGEPLLRNVRLIRELDRQDVFCPGYFDPREDD
jgi:hypothetical protein